MAGEIVEIVGIYNANGGVPGEVAYVVGHLFGRASCSLCDVTHGGLRRKREWDELVASLPVPVRLLHRNETSEPQKDVVATSGLPVVVGARSDGSLTVLVPPLTLDALDGDVGKFGETLRGALEAEAESTA